jgi:hypothetical protein
MMDDVFVVLNSRAVLGMRGWYLPVMNTGIYPPTCQQGLNMFK